MQSSAFSSSTTQIKQYINTRSNSPIPKVKSIHRLDQNVLSLLQTSRVRIQMPLHFYSKYLYNGVLERTKQSAHLHPPLHSKLEHMLFPTNSSNSSTKLLGGSRGVLFPFEVSKKAQGSVLLNYLSPTEG